jgi:hypothetical protein
LGKEVVYKSIALIEEIGFEEFTFKKLANNINTTEASIYRYFENKHKLLLYLINLYWSYLQFIIAYHIREKTPKLQLMKIIHILIGEFPQVPLELPFDINVLHRIIVNEGIKSYMVKDVDIINKDNVFLPYKELCGLISDIIIDINPKYKFPHSLATTMIETAHNQEYFINHLPRLTDVNDQREKDFTINFLKDLVTRILKV